MFCPVLYCTTDIQTPKDDQTLLDESPIENCFEIRLTPDFPAIEKDGYNFVKHLDEVAIEWVTVGGQV